MRREHRKWGQPEENALRETLRFSELYRFDCYDDLSDHKLRQRYIWLWEKGIMQMELSEKQIDEILRQIKIITRDSKEENYDDELSDEEVEAERQLQEINKPTKEKLRYIS
jgi:hypothetical protein